MVGDFDPDEQVRKGVRFLGAKRDRKTGDLVGDPVIGPRREDAGAEGQGDALDRRKEEIRENDEKAFYVPDHVDPAEKFHQDVDGTIRFDFGKHKGEPADQHPGYLRWMLRADFEEETKEVARDLLG